MNKLCLLLFATTFSWRRVQHPTSATADEEAGQNTKAPTDLHADRSTYSTFELTADAPGFMKGGLRTMDIKYHGIKLIEKRVDGIRELVSLFPTRWTCH